MQWSVLDKWAAEFCGFLLWMLGHFRLTSIREDPDFDGSSYLGLLTGREHCCLRRQKY